MDIVGFIGSNQQVAQVCKMARPKIQKWIGDAGEDNAELMGTNFDDNSTESWRLNIFDRLDLQIVCCSLTT
jgi:hypothetical protein